MQSMCLRDMVFLHQILPAQKVPMWRMPSLRDNVKESESVRRSRCARSFGIAATLMRSLPLCRNRSKTCRSCPDSPDTCMRTSDVLEWSVESSPSFYEMDRPPPPAKKEYLLEEWPYVNFGKSTETQSPGHLYEPFVPPAVGCSAVAGPNTEGCAAILLVVPVPCNCGSGPTCSLPFQSPHAAGFTSSISTPSLVGPDITNAMHPNSSLELWWAPMRHGICSRRPQASGHNQT